MGGRITHDWVWLTAWLVGLVLSLAGLVSATRRSRFERFKFVCLVSSVAFVAGTFAIWWLESERRPTKIGYGISVRDDAELTKYLQEKLPRNVQPTKIPTGIYFQSLKFSTANDVEATGYVWQKYPKNTPKSLQKGVVFPEASGAYEMELVIESSKPDYDLYVWFFSTTIRQTFDYTKYPLDRQDMWIRMWHRDFEQGGFLVPDWDSYPRPMNPFERPGLDQEFVKDGWETVYTVFSYQTFKYSTTFGLGTYQPRDPFPELYFNLGLKRNMAGPLMSRIVPLMVVALLLYLALVMTRKYENLETAEALYGFNTYNVMSFCAALFFVTVLDHASMRGTLNPQSLIYLDVFYIGLYVMVLFVAFNSILLMTDKPIRFIQHRNNAIPNLLFWPTLYGFIFLATVFTFTR